MTSNRKRIIGILPLALAGMLASPLALADLPQANKPQNVREMDTNNNGRVEKEEYVAYMTRNFEKAAGSKGYCTFEEVQRGLVGWVNTP